MSATALNKPTGYPPHKTALLLMDYHNFIVGMIQSPEIKQQVLSKVEKLAAVARKNSVPILHCLVDGTQDPLSTSKATDRWKSQLKPTITSQPELLSEPSELLSDGDFTFTRRIGVVSAMKSDGMLDFLKEKGVESLVLCGISTSGVVISTARDATDLGFVVTVVKEGCWDPVDASHQAIMDHVLPMTAWVVDDGKAAQALEGKSIEL